MWLSIEVYTVGLTKNNLFYCTVNNSNVVNTELVLNLEQLFHSSWLCNSDLHYHTERKKKRKHI